ncbi:polysaccharide lyase 8 family protein [Plantibacter sp. VKM Ac-2885]|uniref:polysaccharide lyase 8 family protein n=1 Tax=Plantibacter sp. VKM Ac-2885 TaxID=2783828 RepID=UPI00188AF9D2|nr:polysaccharide lyase 8 family protein [Plantibacter sp. VKM Ac-2885]MBF4514102.1 polysaccharide lyase 8 family protein [Plantibacter sp. VKM Ac-2885]
MTNRPKRRRSRTALLLVAALTVGGVVLPGSEPAFADEFSSARAAWTGVLTGGASIDVSVEPYASGVVRIDADAAGDRDSMTASGEPWADLDTGDAAGLLEAFRRVKAMALAWATQGSSLSGDTALLASTERALDWLIANRYNASTPAVPATWWFWELGIPLELNDITVLLYAERTSAQITAAMDAVEHFRPTVTRTGANRVWAALVVGVRGVVVGDGAKVAAARDGLAAVLPDVTSGDGFYADGSFVQHQYYAYTGGYGVSLLSNIVRLLMLLDDTPWEVPPASVATVGSWISRSFDPLMKNGALMDTARGREISREQSSDHDAGALAARAVLQLAETSSAAQRTALRSIAKRWIASDPLGSYWHAGSLTELQLGRTVIDDSTAVAAAQLQGTWAFNRMDRVAHHGAGFSFAVSMSSSRIANYESINSENLRGWYTGDGMTSLYGTDPDQYGGDYWATVNPYRLPGTTVDTLVRTAGASKNIRPAVDFVGSLRSISGRSGVAAQRLDAASSTLVAQKGWFLFDDEVVAVGAGVTATGQTGTGWDGSPRRVETVMDQRRVSLASQTVIVDGSAAAATVGTPQIFTDPVWAHISGATGSVGYTMPGTAPLTVLREHRTGTWNTINVNGSTDQCSADFISLLFDHGTNPPAARYSYVVLPGATAAQTQTYAASPEAVVLLNTAQVSAVRDSTIGTLGSIFWTTAGGSVPVDGSPFLVSDAAGEVITETASRTLQVSYTDPTQVSTTPVHLEIKRSATASSALSPGVTVTQLTPTIKLTIDPTAAAGRPFTATFSTQ